MILSFISYSLDLTVIFIFLCHLIIPWKENKEKIILYILFSSLVNLIIEYLGLMNHIRLILHVYLFVTLLIVFKIQPIRVFTINYLCVFLFGMAIQLPIVLILYLIYPAVLMGKKFEILLLLLFNFFSYIFCKKVPISKIVNKNMKILEKYAVLLVGIILNIIAANFIVYNYNQEPILLVIISCINIILIFVFYKVNIESNEESALMRTYEQNTIELVPLLNEIRGTQHDFKNHLATIYGLCHEENPEKHIENYIEKVNESLKSVDLILHIKTKQYAQLYTANCAKQIQKT